MIDDIDNPVATGPTPTPAPPKPTPAKASPPAWLLIPVMLVGFVAYERRADWLPKPVPVPVPGPVNPLVTITRDYIRTLPDAYAAVADEVRKGKLTTTAEIAGQLKEHNKGLAAALDSFWAPFMDDKGKIKPGKANEAADSLLDVAKGLR